MTIKTTNAKELTPDTDVREERLADELQLTNLLRTYPDFLQRHPELLTLLDVPHHASGASSLIERQVSLLRDKLKKTEHKLDNLIDIARENERLAQSRHRLAVNLVGARDLDEVVSMVLDETSNELDAEFAECRLITDDQQLLESRPQLYVDKNSVQAFAMMLKHRNPVCGRSSDEQKQFLFGDHADAVASAAIIPLVAGEELGLLGLGSSDKHRFQASMGTDFLRQMGELVSASLAVQLELSR